MLVSSLLTLAFLTNADIDTYVPYRGRPVLSVEIDAPAEENPKELRELVAIEPGYLLSTSNVQEAIKRLYALGRFSSVEVYAQRILGTVELRFFLQATQRLRRIHFEGLSKISADRLHTGVKILPGDEITSDTLERANTELLAQLKKLGYPDAQTITRIEKTELPNTVDLIATIHEGKAVRISAISFSGTLAIPAGELRKQLSSQPGAVFDQEVLEKDWHFLENLYRDRGFLQARVEAPLVQINKRRATIEFQIDANRRHAFLFRGNELFSDRTLQDLLPTLRGPLRDSDISAFTSRILDRYRRAGRFLVKLNIRSLWDPSRNQINYVLEINEGPPVVVHDILFSGNTLFSSALLVEQIESKLRSSLNDDALFETLYDSDILPEDNKTHPQRKVSPEQCWLPNVYEQALEEIADAYRERGYLNVTVGPAIATFEKNSVHVAIHVAEDVQTTVQAVQFRNNSAFSSAELLEGLERAINSKLGTANFLGEGVSQAALEDGRIALVKMYRDRGYLYAQVFTEFSFSENRNTVEVTYRFEEGPQVRIQRILVRGHQFTRESLIRSRISLRPGDLYRLEQVLDDQRSIASLGVFSSVRVRLIEEERADELKDVVAEVIERDRGTLSPKLGVSTADGLRLGMLFSFNNVLGSASTFNASVSANRQVFFGLYGQLADTMRQRYQEDFDFLQTIEREIRMGIRTPRIVGLPLDPFFHFDFVYERDNAIPYSLDSLAAIWGADIFPTRALNIAIEPQVGVTDLRCATQGNSSQCIAAVGSRNAGARRIEQDGTRWLFKVGPSITLDLRDNPLNPSRGVFANLRGSYAIGGATTKPLALNSKLRLDEFTRLSFVKMEAGVTGYVPLSNTVVALLVRGGRIWNLVPNVGVPVDERFFLGGRNDLRGFVEKNLIPEDVCVRAPGFPLRTCPDSTRLSQDDTQSGPPISNGGHFYALARGELRIPVREALALRLFSDVGNLWFYSPTRDSLNVRAGLGTGLSYATPVGPLAMDVGFNPWRRTRNAEPLVQLHFAVGVF